MTSALDGFPLAVYCSGLRRMDAVLGNDEKFIDATLKAAEDLNPSIMLISEARFQLSSEPT